MAFGVFFVPRVESFGELFGHVGELHNVLCAFLEVLECCPSFVSDRADA